MKNAGCLARSIVLLKRSDGSHVGEPRTTPRDLPGYDGRGASTALMLALSRCNGGRRWTWHEMALEQIEREQAAEMERGR